MLSKRVVACLDVKNGELSKGVQFVATEMLGDPVAKAKAYYEDGLDELVFYDITASSDQRNIMLDVVQKVAQEIFIPFSVGGGIRTREDAAGLLMAGAEKISLNSAAVLRPGLIKECAQAIGTQNTVLSMDVRRVAPNTACPSGYEVVINGGRKAMGIDAIAPSVNRRQGGCGLGCVDGALR
jgi:cyclase